MFLFFSFPQPGAEASASALAYLQPDAQSEYQKRYDGLLARFDKAKARHTEVTDLIVERTARRHQIDTYLKELRSREPLTEFRETDWLAMVDYITVHSKKDIRVTFKDGTEIKA